MFPVCDAKIGIFFLYRKRYISYLTRINNISHAIHCAFAVVNVWPLHWSTAPWVSRSCGIGLRWVARGCTKARFRRAKGPLARMAHGRGSCARRPQGVCPPAGVHVPHGRGPLGERTACRHIGAAARWIGGADRWCCGVFGHAGRLRWRALRPCMARCFAFKRCSPSAIAVPLCAPNAVRFTAAALATPRFCAIKNRGRGYKKAQCPRSKSAWALGLVVLPVVRPVVRGDDNGFRTATNVSSWARCALPPRPCFGARGRGRWCGCG